MATQTLPSLATDSELTLPVPIGAGIDEKTDFETRLSPATVPIQMLPSRSCKSARIKLCESPSVVMNRSTRGGASAESPCTRISPSKDVPIHMLPSPS